MKKLFTFLTLMSVFLAVGSAFGQIASDRALVANVPFNFALGKVTLSAGQYTIQEIGVTGKTLLVRGPGWDGRGVIITALGTESTQRSAQCALIFHRYGKQYFLSRIEVEGSTQGLELPKSRAEKEIEVARSDNSQEVVLVAQVR